MGRHSRKESGQAPGPGSGHPQPAEQAGARAAAPAPAPAGWAEPAAAPRGYAAPPRREPVSGARGGHPEQHEPGGAWGAAAGTGTTYGDWRGAPRTRPAAPAFDSPAFGTPVHDSQAFGTPVYDSQAFEIPAFDAPVHDSPAFGTPVYDSPAFGTPVYDAPVYDTPAFGTPAVGFPQVTLDSPMTSTGSHRGVPVAEDAFTATGSHRRIPVHEDVFATTGSFRAVPAAEDVFTETGSRRGVPVGGDAFPGDAFPGEAFTATGSHRRIPAPRAPVVTPVEEPEEAPSAGGRGGKGRTYAGMAAAAVTVALAVIVAGQAVSENDSGKNPVRAADEGNSHTAQGNSAASRSDGRPTPDASAAIKAAPELSYDQKMAQQFPIDEKLKGPGAFDTVPGVAQAPGKGQVVRYRVDVEQGLGLDPQLFAEAVHRTLNDDRSWGHGGTKTFERVPGGEADFVITLASPGTTGVWCKKSGLDTTIDNVSCDSASTNRVMINAYRWAQGSATFGPDQMFAYRQMLINHEVGHRLGHGHVSCQTPGALAPIMQQQTKSLDINGIQCKPNPWVYPGS
ncbi:DUF3152 domain-containing protein [Streptomyces sp. NBC_00193]|uniref:DUF3152 domain-containing protein n=1 Tax=Streptomyces sp. NBC_00193 TaxID=2975675 RepID=UPI00224EED05|nr:DUF3152 domain-containing protein [Streptomyces sp. NBC_00193]MCX5296000.1 DUF3152 domain-containing protein [Streptomyces sp. NBC_00193]